MGTSKGKNKFAPRIFMGSSERTSFLILQEILPSSFPYLQTRCFQGLTMLTRTENASWGSLSLLRVAHCYQTYPRLGEGILTTLPFSRSAEAQYARVLCRLGSTNPCTKAVHMEPFSTSVFLLREEDDDDDDGCRSLVF